MVSAISDYLSFTIAISLTVMHRKNKSVTMPDWVQKPKQPGSAEKNYLLRLPNCVCGKEYKLMKRLNVFSVLLFYMIFKDQWWLFIMRLLDWSKLICCYSISAAHQLTLKLLNLSFVFIERSHSKIITAIIKIYLGWFIFWAVVKNFEKQLNNG